MFRVPVTCKVPRNPKLEPLLILPSWKRFIRSLEVTTKYRASLFPITAIESTSVKCLSLTFVHKNLFTVFRNSIKMFLCIPVNKDLKKLSRIRMKTVLLLWLRRVSNPPPLAHEGSVLPLSQKSGIRLGDLTLHC